MAKKWVLNVGHCRFDHGNITRMLAEHFEVEVVATASAKDALAKLQQQPFDLVLVNRIFDQDGSSGLELLQQIKADESLRRVPAMLVSNYEDAQHQAVVAGAAPGFGKAALHEPETLNRLKPFLE